MTVSLLGGDDAVRDVLHHARLWFVVGLGDNPDRRARFMSTLALVWPDGHEEVFEGWVDGMLVWPPRGEIGWGYDPMFAPEGGSRTYGEMPAEEKHATSHRARALAKLVAACFDGR